jgi:hypothetical protein|tara:strand:+ start:291 stop:464 length:174 start_codon:yes stop_codon:yes gene_type:complete
MSNTRDKFYLIKNAPSGLKDELKPLGVKAIRARIAEHNETVGECDGPPQEVKKEISK